MVELLRVRGWEKIYKYENISNFYWRTVKKYVGGIQ